MDTKSLFEEVKMHIFDNMNNDNVPLLSSIAKATAPFSFVEYDFHSVDDALGLIHEHFREHDQNYERNAIFSTFGSRVLVENVDQLTSNYNRVMKNLRREFPEFTLAQESHNDIFGSDAPFLCRLRRCSEEEVEAYVQMFRPDRRENAKRQILESYDNGDYVDTIAAKAPKVEENGLSIFPPGLRDMFAYNFYTGGQFVPINQLFRSDKMSEIPLDTMVMNFNRFAQNLVLPFYTQQDFVMYRGDGLSVSSQKFTTKGFFSGSLSVPELGRFVRNGGRFLQINIPKGTPFLPFLLHRIDEGEIALLPNTVLQKESEMEFQNGHFAEYTVTENPPKLTDLEEATLFKHAIPPRFEEVVWRLSGEKKEQAKNLPKAEGVAPFNETVQFAVDLINSKYGGDW